MALPTYLERAGKLGLPAAILHPEQELPKTWRVLSTWQHGRQRGAYLLRSVSGLPYQERGRGVAGKTKRAHRDLYSADFAQVVYRANAKRRNNSRVGLVLNDASLGFRHLPRPSDWQIEQHQESHRAANCCPEWRERRDYYAERGIDIDALDLEADAEAARREAAERAARHAANGVPATPPPAAPPAPPKPAPIPAISSPPEPSMDRVEWLGKRIALAMPYQSSDIPTHAQRRSAARKVLARVRGYEATRPDDDALFLVSASAILAGLNEYARRVLDEGQPPITAEGFNDALL